MAHLTRPAVISGVSAGSFPKQRLVIEPTCNRYRTNIKSDSLTKQGEKCSYLK